MKKVLLWLPPAAAIALLLLNIFERDIYEFGRRRPPKDRSVPLITQVLPERLVHACTACGECTHPIEVLESRRLLSIRDRDGWYRLFWAADETYYYEDPVHFAAEFANATAQEPRGDWTIRARIGPATHAAASPHECGTIPGIVELEYRLTVAEEPPEERSASAAGSPLKISDTFPLLSYRYDVPHRPSMLHFIWKLARPPRIDAVPCRCAKP